MLSSVSLGVIAMLPALIVQLDMHVLAMMDLKEKMPLLLLVTAEEQVSYSKV